MLAALQSTLSPPRLSQPAYVRLLEAAKPVPLDYGCGVSIVNRRFRLNLKDLYRIRCLKNVIRSQDMIQKGKQVLRFTYSV